MDQKAHPFLQDVEDFIFSCKGDKSLHLLEDVRQQVGLSRDKFNERWRGMNYTFRDFNTWCYMKMGAAFIRDGKYDTITHLMRKLNYSEKHFYLGFNKYYDVTPGIYSSVFTMPEEAKQQYVFHDGVCYHICRHCGAVKRL